MRSLTIAPLAMLAVLAVLLHLGAVAAAKPGDPQLSAIAGQLSGRHVTIRCEGLSGALTGPRGKSGRTEFIGDRPVSVSYPLAASSVAPMLRLLTLPTSLPANEHRTPATSTVSAKPS
jgi:hypothetical protein